jgi:glutamate 5-kinase
MENYRQFISPSYSVRQVLVEHSHFNDPEKREHLYRLFMRAPMQNAIPIVNYNDPVSSEENRKMELKRIGEGGIHVVECVDNDETAAVIAGLVKAKTLVLLTSTEGIYQNPADPNTLVREVSGNTIEEVVAAVKALQQNCIGASRAGANGARAKLEYALGPLQRGTTVIIGHARHHLRDLVNGTVLCTRLGLK